MIQAYAQGLILGAIAGSLATIYIMHRREERRRERMYRRIMDEIRRLEAEDQQNQSG